VSALYYEFCFVKETWWTWYPFIWLQRNFTCLR